MQPATPVFIVTSTRPRVGKTLVARALIECLCFQRRPVAAFDVNPDEFSLLDRLPAYTAAASIRDTNGEMALFDQLIAPDQVAKVVDLGHTLFDQFFAVLRQIGLTGEARRRAIYPLVLFVADADDRARQGYAMLRDRFPELPLAPVFNENIPRLADWREKFPLTFHGVGSLTIPALTPVLRSVIDRPGFSFVGYAMKTTDPTTELYGWMRKVFVPLREMESRLLLDELLLELKRTG